MPYQILLLDRIDRTTASIEAAIRKETRAWLGTRVPADFLVFARHIDDVDVQYPVAAVFRGVPIPRPEIDRQAEEARRRGILIVPTVPNTAIATASLPAVLHNVLALSEADRPWEALVAARVLTELGLGRGPRPRVFLSYARTRQPTAQKLRDALAAALQYEVVMDEGRLAAGDAIDERLYPVIADCDLLLQLRSDDAIGRPWLDWELEVAALTGVGILAISWPDVPSAPDWVSDVRLHPSDFRRTNPNNLPLVAATRRILREVVEWRSRAVARRRARLERGLVQGAETRRWSAVRDPARRFIDVSTDEPAQERWVPALGITTIGHVRNARGLAEKRRPRLGLDGFAHLGADDDTWWLLEEIRMGLALNFGRFVCL